MIGAPLSTYFPDLTRVQDEPGGSHIEPELEQSWDDLTKLRWHGRVTEVDAGLDLGIRIEPDGQARPDLYRYGRSDSVVDGWSFDRVWDHLNAIEDGIELYRAALAASRPEIVVLCGSTRFYDQFQQANYDLTMAGKIVLSVGFYPHATAQHGHGEGVGHDSIQKFELDELHKRKIDLADRVYVLNVDGYTGVSTRSEIHYALLHGKPIDYLEPDYPAVITGAGA